MKQLFSLLIVFSFGFTQAQTVSSPSGKITLSFQLSSSGQPTYSVNYKMKSVVVSSDLGIQLKDKPALNINFEIPWRNIDAFVADVMTNALTIVMNRFFYHSR